jgi:histidinol-phosphatase (PHP family)
MLADYHIHFRSGDVLSRNKPEDYVNVAKSRGVSEIGFSDHIAIHDDSLSYVIKLKDFAAYAKEVKGLKADMPIRLGVEMDFLEGFENKIREFLTAYPFDYALGSVHWIDGRLIDEPKILAEYGSYGIYKLYQKYFGMVQKAARSGLFNIMAHIDLIKIFGFRPKEDIRDILEETARALRAGQICVEINTQGLMRKCNEMYPSEELLKICFDYGVNITLGSDAHFPKNVGKDFDKAVALARKVGYDKVATFKGRKMKLVELG